ncbi:MAG: hypothetical protein RLZZ393_1883 [Pseudomonadota bacterium]
MDARNRGAKAAALVAAALLGVLPATAPAAELKLLALQPVSTLETPGLRLRVQGTSRRFDLQLEPNTDLVRGGRLGGTEALRGTLPGQPGSWARLTRRNGRYHGIYSDGVDTYILEAAGAMARASATAAMLPPDATVLYRLADLQVRGVLLEGDSRSTVRTAADALGQVGAEIAAATALQATKRLDVGVLADSELVALDGAATDSRALERLNVVDGIFSSQVGVQIRLAGVTHVDTAAESLSATDPSQLIDAVAAYRLRTTAQQSAGLTHLMTGRDLDGTTVGIAYLGALCSRGFSASLSEARASVSFDALVAAHEIGHVFGAPHDGEAAAACAATADNQFLMAPRMNGSSTFSACSLQQIAPTVAAASCLGAASIPDPVADLALGLSGGGAQVTVGDSTLMRVTVQNLGLVAVPDATLSFTVPSGATVTGATSTAVDCVVSGSALRCPAFALAANAQAALDIRLRADREGSLTLTASLSSPTVTDPQMANNSATATVTGIAAPAAPPGGGSGNTGGGGGSGAGLAALAALLLAGRAGRRYWPVLEK